MKKILMLVLLSLGHLALAAEGARYLIISTDALAPVVQPLAQWKHFSGMQCKVVKLSEIGGADTTAIRNYIRNAYNNWPVRPEYVLLVGSPNNLPARFYRIQGGYGYYSDNIYGDVNGDLYMDIPLGRLPAKSARQCSVMVYKTLAYERHPDLTDSLWMRRLTTVVRENSDSDDTIYWNDIRIAATLAGSNNFVSCDSLSYLRGDDATDVVNSVTNGTAMVLYRGTAVENWYQPFTVNPALTNNRNKLPIILSITCETMTLAPNESMVGDAWVKAGTPTSFKGAVAFFGNTHSLSSSTTTVRKRSAVCRAFFKTVFQENTPILGKAMIRAKDSLYRAFADVAEYRGFNLFGDPALDIWTDTPRLPDVNHPAEIQPGEQEFPVLVYLNNQPVANALVCVSMDTLIYQYGYTDQTGLIVFNINPPDTGRLRLVVTGHNLYPYDTLIPVQLTGIAEQPQMPVQVKPIATPRAFVNTTRFTWTPKEHRADITIYDATGRPVWILSSAENGTLWNGTDRSGNNLPAGIYFSKVIIKGRNLSATVKLMKLR
ncbi:MAG: C25 family cysteine peptidase [candidate division WOR-3 bacterium]